MLPRWAWGCSPPCDLPPPPAPHRICSEDIECSGLTIPKAVQYLSSQDEKCQAIGAYYIQHTCFQDECAKQQVAGYAPSSPEGWPHLEMGGASAAGAFSPCPAA